MQGIHRLRCAAFPFFMAASMACFMRAVNDGGGAARLIGSSLSSCPDLIDEARQ
jgi:hypothetical protein